MGWDAMSVQATDPVTRFWQKVDLNGPTSRPALGQCWQWLGAQCDGYGRHTAAPGVVVYTHRYAYELLVGPVPAGLQLDHICRHRACVNPAHLEPVTQRVNMLRGEGPAAVNARKTHCPKGHPLSGDNVYAHTVRATGTPGRRCRTCNTEAAREYRKLRAGRVAA
jgi:hypothetical protein